MASGALDVVQQLLFSRLENAGFDPELPISYPSIAFTPPNRDTPDGTRDDAYLLVTVLPNTSDLDGIAYDSGVNDAGLLSVNVVWPAGQGVQPAVRFARQVVAAFAPSTVLFDQQSGVTVRVHEQPRIAPPVEGNDSVTIPVIVRWVADTPSGAP